MTQSQTSTPRASCDVNNLSQSTRKDSDRLIGYALATLAAVGWSTGGLVSKWLFTEPSAKTLGWPIPPLGIAIDPATLSGSRALAGVLILGCLLLVFGRKELVVPQPIKSLWFLVPFGAIALAGMHFTYFKTISLTNVATAILLEYLAPIFTLIVGVVWMKHKLTWQMPLGVLMSIGGCAVVVGAFSEGGLSITLLGLGWGVVSALFFALYSLMGSAGSLRFRPFTLLFYGLLFAALMWCVALGPVRVLSPFMQWQTAAAVVGIACISTIIPFGAYLIALRYISPTHATVTAMLEPVVAGFGAYVFFSEPITSSLIIGGTIVIVSIALIQLSDSAESHVFPVQD